MAEQKINVNGTPVVFNNAIVIINGVESDINGYVTGINWSTGTQSEHVKTMTQSGNPITTNNVVSSPVATISFAPSTLPAFNALTNNKYNTISMVFEQYVTGNIGGATLSLLIENARVNENQGSSRSNSPQNDSSLSFVATFVGYI